MPQINHSPPEPEINGHKGPNAMGFAGGSHPIRIEPFKVACSACNLRELCLPLGLSQHNLERLDTLVSTRRTLARGDALFRTGDAFQSLYAVRTGFFKTCVASEDGRDQVTGFQMAGELLGLDGISNDRHSCDAVALEDSQVCVIPFSQLEVLSREFTELQRQFHTIMSREIVREHGAGPRLLGVGPGTAHDTRGDRQLPRPETGDGEPHLL